MSFAKLPPRWNRHHTWYRKSEYETRFEKKFREHYANVIATPVINHNLLHAKVSEPPKPSREIMGHLLDYLEDTPVAVQMDRLWSVQKTISFFNQLSQPENEQAFVARRTADNLTSQMGYLSMQLVEIKIL